MYKLYCGSKGWAGQLRFTGFSCSYQLSSAWKGTLASGFSMRRLRSHGNLIFEGISTRRPVEPETGNYLMIIVRVLGSRKRGMIARAEDRKPGPRFRFSLQSECQETLSQIPLIFTCLGRWTSETSDNELTIGEKKILVYRVVEKSLYVLHGYMHDAVASFPTELWQCD